MSRVNRSEKLSQAPLERILVATPLRTDHLPKPEFVGGNLTDPLQILTPEERTATNLALNSLAHARNRDSQSMTGVSVD